MKRIAIVLCSFLMLCAAASAKDKKEKIQQTDLPVKSQEFIANSFAQSLVKSVVKLTSEQQVETFLVTFKDKSKIEFDMVGAWSSVWTKKGEVSDMIAPVRVRSVLRTQYAGKKIVAADNDGLHYHFVLDDNTEVRINALGDEMK